MPAMQSIICWPKRTAGKLKFKPQRRGEWLESCNWQWIRTIQGRESSSLRKLVLPSSRLKVALLSLLFLLVFSFSSPFYHFSCLLLFFWFYLLLLLFFRYLFIMSFSPFDILWYYLFIGWTLVNCMHTIYIVLPLLFVF